EPNTGADGAAITLRPFQLELYPLILRYYRVFVNQEWPFLVGDDDVEHAAIPQVGERDSAAVVSIRDADGLGDIDELAILVKPDAFLLVAGQAAALHGVPVLGVGDNRLGGPGHLGIVVPIGFLAAVRGDVAVGQVQVEKAVIVQIAKLRAPA